MRRLCPWETAPGLRWLDVLRSPFYEPNSYTSPNLEKHQPPSWRRRLLVVSSNCHETSGILCKETRARLHVPSPPPESPPYWPCPSASWEQCLSDLRRCLSGYSPHSAPNQTTHNSHVVLFFKCKAVSIPHYYDPHSQPCLLPSLSGYKDEMLGLVLNYSNSSEGFIQNAYVPREIGLNKLN